MSDISARRHQALSFSLVPGPTTSPMTKSNFIPGSRFSSDTTLRTYAAGKEYSVYTFDSDNNPVVLVYPFDTPYMSSTTLFIQDFEIFYSFEQLEDDDYLGLKPIFVRLYFKDEMGADKFDKLILAGEVDVSLIFGNGNLRFIALEVEHG